MPLTLLPVPPDSKNYLHLCWHLPHSLFLTSENFRYTSQQRNFSIRNTKNYKSTSARLDISFGTFHHLLCSEVASVETDVRW